MRWSSAARASFIQKKVYPRWRRVTPGAPRARTPPTLPPRVCCGPALPSPAPPHDCGVTERTRYRARRAPPPETAACNALSATRNVCCTDQPDARDCAASHPPRKSRTSLEARRIERYDEQLDPRPEHPEPQSSILLHVISAALHERAACDEAKRTANLHRIQERPPAADEDTFGRTAFRELRDSLREDSYGQEYEQALSTVHPDDLSSRIIAYAERYASRYEPIPYTLSSEFEHQRDISSISGSTETSTETMVEGIDYQINPCQPLASYPVQEARGGQFIGGPTAIFDEYSAKGM